MQAWTPIIIMLIPILLGLMDVFLYWLGGNAATISAVMLQIRVKYPLSAIGTTYTLGVLIGHLYFPKFAVASPPTHEVLAQMMVGLSPAFYALIIIASGNGSNAAHSKALNTGGQLVFAGYTIASFIAGGCVGAFILSQHVAPEDLP